MANVTQTVCDACGRSKMGATGKEIEQLNLEVTNGPSIKMDVHPTKRCIVKAVVTALEKHFSVNGAG